MEKTFNIYKNWLKLCYSFQNKELNEIYFAESVRGFALGMLNIFIPIYLIKLGYPIQSVVLMYFVQSLWHVIFVIPATNIASRYGFKKLNFLSMFVYILFLFMLSSLQRFAWPLTLLALVGETGSIFYYIWYHTQITRATNAKVLGSQIGLKDVVSGVVQLPAAFIGGIVLTFLGIHILITVVSVLFVISVLPLLFSKEDHTGYEQLTLKKVFRNHPLKHYIIFAAHGVDNILNSFVWPVFIFFSVLQSYVILGFATFLTTLFSFFLNIVIGKSVDGKRENMLRFGAVLGALTWIAKLFTTTNISVYAANSVNGISQEAISISFGAKSYDIAREAGVFRFLIFREVMIHVGRLFLYTALFFVANWSYTFIGGAILLMANLFY